MELLEHQLPLMNAAGLLKTPADVEPFLRLPVPAVMLGSYTLEERSGNPGTTFFADSRGTLNSLGMPGPAFEVWGNWLPEILGSCHDSGRELWVSVAGFSPAEYAQLAVACLERGVDAIELNLGCPNVLEGSQRKRIASYHPDFVEEILHEVGKVTTGEGSCKVGVKLSPLIDPSLLDEVDKVLNRIDWLRFVTSMNTVPNCAAFDETKRDAIRVPQGLAGFGGAGTKWIGLGQCIQHGAALRDDIEIIGVGGITTGADLSDYLSIPRVKRCQVGSALWNGGPGAVIDILADYAATI